jgi:hypothetical protein
MTEWANHRKKQKFSKPNPTAKLASAHRLVIRHLAVVCLAADVRHGSA